MLGPLKGVHLQAFKAPLKPYNVWNGAVSSGKTWTTCLKLVDFVLNGPEGEIMLVGKTERTLEQNVIDPLIKIFGRGIRKVGSSVYIFGRRCYIRGANDERAEEKIRGISLVCAYCDELTLYPETFFKMLLTRLREPDAVLIATTNPDSPTHFLLETFLEKEEIKPDINIWFSTMDDNPYLTDEYRKRMLAAYPVGSLWYKRYILGLWVAAEGMIYDMFSDKHIVDILPETFDKYYVSCDYGTMNPTVFLLFGIKGNVVYCIKEYYHDGRTSQKQRTDLEYSNDLQEFIKGYRVQEIIIDPSAASFITQVRRVGLPVRQAKNDVLDGIRTCSTFLHTGRYFVHRSCKNHIKEFYGYSWDENSRDRGEDIPKKENDHTMDAMRYLVFTVYGKGETRAIIFGG